MDHKDNCVYWIVFCTLTSILAILSIIFAILYVNRIPAPTDQGFFLAALITGGAAGAVGLSSCWAIGCAR